MDELIEQLMKQINQNVIEGQTPNKNLLLAMINESKVEDINKQEIKKIIMSYDDTIKLNRTLFGIAETFKSNRKYKKSFQKYRNTESNSILVKDYQQFENYVYSLIETKTYSSKMSKTKRKVRLLDIHNLFGYDSEECHKDLFQEGKLYLWEGLKKYGELPEKGKSFNKDKDRTISSKSTFVFKNLENHLKNLGERASSEKFQAILEELKPEFNGEENISDE